jgi:hypothetical protein
MKISSFSLQPASFQTVWQPIPSGLSQTPVEPDSGGSLDDLIARVLEESGLGQFAFISSLIYLANIAATFGTDTLLIREIAAGRDRSTSGWGSVAAVRSQRSPSWRSGWHCLCCPIDRPKRFSIQVYSWLLPPGFPQFSAPRSRASERMDFTCVGTYNVSSSKPVELFPFSSREAGCCLFRWLAATQMLLPPRSQAGHPLDSNFTFALQGFQASACSKPLKKSWPLALLQSGVIYQRLGLLMVAFLSGDAAAGWFSAAAES